MKNRQSDFILTVVTILKKIHIFLFKGLAADIRFLTETLNKKWINRPFWSSGSKFNRHSGWF